MLFENKIYCKIFYFAFKLSHRYFMRNKKLFLHEISDIPEHTVVSFVLASSFARVIFVNRRRQLPEGFAARAGSSAGFAIRFSCEGMSCARVLTPGWWERTYGVARWVFIERAGIRGETNETSYTRVSKVAQERRRINAGQTSVTMYTYGREGWTVRSYHEGNWGV